MNKAHLQQVLKFVVVGCIAVIADSVVYYFLSQFILIELAKALSFMSGMFFSYTLNKLWTFSQKKRSVREMIKFLVLYATSLAMNVLINGLTLQITSSFAVAFLTATAFSTLLNFVGQRWWVYKS